VKSHWFLACGLMFLLVGCASTSKSGAAKSPYTAQATANQTWAQKITSPFKSDKKHTAPPVSREPHLVQNVPARQNGNGEPSSVAVYLSMAEMSDRIGNTQHAREMYQRAISGEPGNREALLGIARLEDREGNFEAAIYHYQQAASRHPHDSKVHNDLALCLARSGQIHASLQLLDRLVQQQPDKHLYRNNIAKVLIELNREADALRHLSAVYPASIAQYNMGVLLADRGRTADAVAHLNEALRFNPQLQEAQTLLAEIIRQSGPPASETRLGSYQPQTPGVSGGSNEHIASTRITPPSQADWRYPSTRTPAEMSTARLIPGETAQVPVGHSPVVLPPLH